MIIIIFFGPPGSGKGTQASLLSKQYKIPHLSTGDILRNKLSEGDSLSVELKKILSSGDLVSDYILNKIISQKLLSSDCKKGFLIDGYPRTEPQSNFLISFFNEHNIQPNLIVNFHLDKVTIQNRILSRSKIENRSDDNIEVIRTRIEKYELETEPLTNLYKKKFPNNFLEINANQEINKIQSDLLNYIKNANF